MKQYIPLIFTPLVFLFGLFFYTKIAGPIPFSVSSVNTNKQDAFVVSGEGKVFVTPDVASVSLGVQANGSTVKDVQEKTNAAINKVVSSVKSLGIDSKDIKTTNYSVNPSYDFSSGTQRITGFQANSTVSIKVRDVTKVNSVIDAATSAGANQVGGVSFDVDDRTQSESEARKLAVADAKKKAEQAASIAGFHLGKLINYQENFGGGSRPIPMMAMSKDSAEVTNPTQVEAGTNEIVVTVILSYEIL